MWSNQLLIWTNQVFPYRKEKSLSKKDIKGGYKIDCSILCMHCKVAAVVNNTFQLKFTVFPDHTTLMFSIKFICGKFVDEQGQQKYNTNNFNVKIIASICLALLMHQALII